jgi:hypothetical protein
VALTEPYRVAPCTMCRPSAHAAQTDAAQPTAASVKLRYLIRSGGSFRILLRSGDVFSRLAAPVVVRDDAHAGLGDHYWPVDLAGMRVAHNPVRDGVRALRALSTPKAQVRGGIPARDPPRHRRITKVRTRRCWL